MQCVDDLELEQYGMTLVKENMCSKFSPRGCVIKQNKLQGK